MGLDMYIMSRSKTEPHGGLREEAYWRKTNCLHGYIVRKYADGVDECQEIPLNLEDIKSIGDDVEKAIQTRDATIFPPTPGFFFGSYAVDDYYWDDLEYTLARLMAVIAQWDDNRKYFYQASW